MTFLNIILLLGVSAAAVPILIHFLHRGRLQRVRWGAMNLIDAAFRQNSRRIRFEHILLLLLRGSIPALLALTMARPVLTRNRALLGHEKTSLAILLDNSYSMEAGGGDNSSFAEAKSAAIHILERLEQDSDACVLLMAGGEDLGGMKGTHNLTRLAQEVQDLQSGYGRADIPASLAKVAERLPGMQNRARQIIILSDFQRASWPADEAARRTAASKLLRTTNTATELTLWHMGKENRDNLCVESLELPRNIITVKQPFQVRANLRNFGQKAWPDLRVYFRVDDKERAVAQISVGAQQRSHVLFSHTFDAPGSHLIQVVAEGDALRADNVFTAAVPVWEKIPVLLVTGNKSSQPLEGETDFLEIALQPFANANSDSADLLQSKVIAPEELNGELLSQTRVVVLANVRQLTDRQVQSLKTFVREGGGCMIFPGDRVNAEWYNRVLGAAPDAFLPALFHSIRGAGDGPGTHIAAENHTHSALQYFNNPRNGNLSDATIKLWFELHERTAPKGSTLVRLENGDPFLVEQKYGEGRVIEAAGPCDSDWSNLPARPFYLPLMQRLMIYLASAIYPPRNLDAGHPLLVFLPSSEAGKKAFLLDAAGRRHELEAQGKGAHALIEYDDTEQPGLYLLNLPDGQAVHFVVNTSRDESDLEELSESERKNVAREMNASLVDSPGDYQRLDYASRFGRELWQGLLWLVLFATFSELLLQQHFSRRNM